MQGFFYCGDITHPVVRRPLVLECLVSLGAKRLDILDLTESLGILQILRFSIYLVQTSRITPAFLRESVKTPPHPSSSLLSDFSAQIKESDTLKTGTRSLPRRFLIVLNNTLQSLCSFLQPEVFDNHGGKKSFFTELLPWQSSILHLSVKHQKTLTSQSITFGCLESSNPLALLAVRRRR